MKGKEVSNGRPTFYFVAVKLNRVGIRRFPLYKAERFVRNLGW